jgi:hypothetical protein
LADVGFQDYNVLWEGEVIGRFLRATAATPERPWFWGIAHGHYRDPHPPRGYDPTREAANGRVPQELDAAEGLFELAPQTISISNVRRLQSFEDSQQPTGLFRIMATAL